METLTLIGKGLDFSAPTHISKETKCKAVIKRDEPVRLIVEGNEKDLCEALELIAARDLFAEVNEIECSEGADFMFSEKRIKRILRLAKRKRFAGLLKTEFNQRGQEGCPINSFGYMPYPFNTPKTLLSDQSKDAKNIASCVSYQSLNSYICKGCHTASIQRATAERQKDSEGD